MSYWTFSDASEEQGVVKMPFYGGYGLIAEGGIPKAAFSAFAMLHRLGDRRLNSDVTNALVTDRADGTLAIAVWNSTGDQGTPQHVQIAVDGWKPTAQFHVELLDRDHGSAITA